MNTTTKKGNSFTQLSKPLVAVLALIVGGFALALTDAGTVIKNLATVTYNDINGDSYTATSNEAEVVVAPVLTATLEYDNVGGEAAPGQTVNFPHVLTNTGNGTDTYTVTAVDDAGNQTANNIRVFLDENGNGQPDAGEVEVPGGLITLDAGEAANLVVSITIPATATAGQIFDALLTATSGGGGTVDDLTAANGIDTLEGTNQDRVTVTLDEVLVSTKDSVLVGNTITYTLTVKNTGGSDATDVDIFDAIPAGTTFNAGSVTVSGLLTANGDTKYVDDAANDGVDNVTEGFVIPADLTGVALTDDFDEPTGIDLDGNGVTGETGVSGFVVRDAILPPNTTISVTYTVDIAGAPAGSVFKNRFCAGEDINGPADADTTFNLAANVADCSNQTIDQIGFVFAIDADDTDGDGGAVNTATGTVGDDEDGVDDDVQFVLSGALGESVVFKNVITNNGTANDIIDLAIIANTFPPGTVFTFWESNNLVPLTDNNNNGIPDTGVVTPGSSETIVVRATLPQTITPAAVAQVLLETGGVTLANGGAAIELVGGSYFLDVDGNNGNDGAQVLAGDDGFQGNGTADVGTQDFDIGNAGDDIEDDEIFYAVLKATSSEDASQVDYKLEGLGSVSAPIVDLANSAAAAGFNDAGVADAHPLAATPVFVFGNDVADDDGAGNGVVSGNSNPDGVAVQNDGPVALGQTVTFPLFIANEGANLDAYELSFTGGAGLDVEFQNGAGETITATPALSSGETFNYSAVVKVTDAAAAGNIDITFTVTSPTTGATDSKLDRVVVAVNCEVGITPATLQQIQAGGNVDYVHTFTNNSNDTVTTYVLTVALSDAEWSSLLVVQTSDDAAFNPGDVIDSGDTVTLAQGESITFTNRVFAPSSAIDGQTEVSTITITPDGSCGVVKVEDVASVIVGQVRLDKTSAIDADCACDETVFNRVGVDTPNLDGLTPSQVVPGECVQWQLVATNEGDETATSVVINDSITEFSVLHSAGTYDGSLPGGPNGGLPVADEFKVCVDAGCTLAAVTSGGGAGANGGSVTFANPDVTFTVGTLAPGESATAQFCVQVQ